MEGKRPGCVAQVEALAQGIAIVRIPNTPEHRPAVAQHLPIRGAGKNIVVLQMKNFAARHLLRQGALHGESARLVGYEVKHTVAHHYVGGIVGQRYVFNVAGYKFHVGIA